MSSAWHAWPKFDSVNVSSKVISHFTELSFRGQGTHPGRMTECLECQGKQIMHRGHAQKVSEWNDHFEKEHTSVLKDNRDEARSPFHALQSSMAVLRVTVFHKNREIMGSGSESFSLSCVLG